MGEFNEHQSTFIQKGRLLFYASCAVTSLLIGTSFCLFALHQIRLDRIESAINDIQDTFAKLDSVEKNADNHAVDLLHRYARQTDSDNVDSPSSVDMDKLLEEIIKLQVTIQCTWGCKRLDPLLVCTCSCDHCEPDVYQIKKSASKVSGICSISLLVIERGNLLGPKGSVGDKGDNGRRGPQGMQTNINQN